MPESIASRVSVLESRFANHSGGDGHASLSDLRTEFAVFKARVTIYAGIGAFLGGAIINLLVLIASYYFRVHP